MRKRTGNSSRTSKRTAKKDTTPKRRGGVKEEGMSSASNLGGGYINKFKLEAAKDKQLIMFPVVNEHGEPRVKTIEHFACKYGSKLSDGKWHSFQLPDSDEAYEMALENPNLEKTTTRFALVLIYDTNNKGKVDSKASGVGYYYAWLKVSDFVKGSISDVYEENDETLKGQDIIVKLAAKDNALKMQEMIYTLPRSTGGVAKKNKASSSFRDITKEAEEIWGTLEDRVVRRYEDDEVIALVDDYSEPDEEERPRRGSSRSGRGSKTSATKKKRRFNKKDFS